MATRQVFLRDLVLAARIGVHAHEHRGSQRIRINIDLSVEEEGEGVGVGVDRLARVVDYEAVANNVRTIVAAGHVQLVETLAERIAESCLTDRRVTEAVIRVEKLDIFPDAASAGVEIRRRPR